MQKKVEDGPIPTAWHHGLYRLATPFIKRLIADPDNAEATKVLAAINTVIIIDNRQLGVSRGRYHDFVIRYHAIAGQAKGVALAQKSFPEDTRKKLLAIDACNTAIAEIVQQKHYPTSWKAKFSLDKNGENIQIFYPAGVSAAVNEWRPPKLQRAENVWWRNDSPTNRKVTEHTNKKQENQNKQEAKFCTSDAGAAGLEQKIDKVNDKMDKLMGMFG